LKLPQHAEEEDELYMEELERSGLNHQGRSANNRILIMDDNENEEGEGLVRTLESVNIAEKLDEDRLQKIGEEVQGL
jgi:hypothetical protein